MGYRSYENLISLIKPNEDFSKLWPYQYYCMAATLGPKRNPLRKSRFERHKHAACCFDQILEGEPYKTAAVQLFTFYLTKQTSKTGNTYWTLLEKRRQSQKCRFPMDLHLHSNFFLYVFGDYWIHFSFICRVLYNTLTSRCLRWHLHWKTLKLFYKLPY